MIQLESVAYAAEGARGIAGIDILILVAFVAIFYFLLWRPQSKRRKEHQALMASLAKGDEVVTAGGILGLVTKVEDDFVMVRVAGNVELRVQKSAVGSTLPKGTLKALDDKRNRPTRS